MYEHGWHVKGQIGVTEPRRISAITLADRVASERGEILGETVGVSVSFVDKYSESTQIKVTYFSLLYILIFYLISIYARTVHDRRNFVA